VPQNNICDNTTYCIKIVCVAIHSYCYNICWMYIHPNAILDYMTIKAIAMISVIAIIIDSNVLLRRTNHGYCNNIINCCKVLLQCYYMQPLLTKVTLSPLECIATNMTLLQPYCKVLLQCYYMQPLLTKVTLLPLECIATNMTLLQPYFIVAIDQFSSSGINA
jgi:hypothetical protein